jgi:hypothetical protein
VAGGLLGAAVTMHQSASAQGTDKSRDAKLDAQVIERKLDSILINQQEILQQLQTMMEELRIIKVRSTR